MPQPPETTKPPVTSAEENLIAARRAKAQALRERGENPFANNLGGPLDDLGLLRARFDDARKRDDKGTPTSRYDREHPLFQAPMPVHVAGRVLFLRSFGKTAFARIRDRTGELQLYFQVAPDALTNEAIARLDDLDLGDHVEATGLPMATEKGELSVNVRSFRVLTKALRPLPEKHKGLVDVEQRYRQRYVDLIANPEVKAVFEARSRIVQAVRRYLDGEGFVEVETPLLHTVIGGAAAKPFITHHNALNLDLYLRIAPELYLKRLVVGGFERVYELGRNLRNEGISTRHNPEFTMVEFYEAYATYESLMTRTEELLRSVDAALQEAMPAHYAVWSKDRPFTLDEPFRRLSMKEAVAAALAKAELPPEVPSRVVEADAPIKEWASKSPRAKKQIDWANYRKGAQKCESEGERLFAAYEYLAEPFLAEDYRSSDGSRSLPVFILDYPAEVSPLARRKDSDPSLVDRFELFVHGRELCNAFSELNDPDDQRRRFEDQVAKKSRGVEETMDFDEDYIRALEHGMAPTAGFGMGIDRLVMMLTNQPSIRDVILFPLLRPEKLMNLHPGLLVLFALTLLSLTLVLRRAMVRARETTPLRVAGGVTALLVTLALTLGASVGAGVSAWAQALVAPTLTLGGAPKVVPLGWQAWMAKHHLLVGLLAALPVSIIFLAPVLKLRGRLLPGWMRAVPWAVSALLGLAFIGMTLKAQTLPVLRGSRYILTHELLRFGALATGVLFLLSVLAALLPILLDRLEGRGFVPFVGARHVRATKSGFLTVISVLSICGVAVSSCSLCSVVSIMGGFGADLKRKILGNNAHITVDMPTQLEGFPDYVPMTERIGMVPGVAAATPVVVGEGMASSNANTAGVLIRGVDPATIGGVIDLVKNIEYGKLDYLIDETKLQDLPPDEPIGAGPGGEPYRRGPSPAFSMGLDPAVHKAIGAPVLPGIIIGRELARTMHLMVGDEFTLVSPLGDLGPMGVLPRSRKFRVAAIFYSGMYEYDATHVYVRIDVAQKFFSLDGKATTIEIRTHDAEATEALLPAISERVGNPNLRVRDWREMNKNLFSALKLERVATFIILSIAIAVASFCIICTLLLMVTEKGKEIAILKALGASDGAIRAIFMSEGVLIGAIGTAFGVGTGMATTLGFKWFGVRLDPDVYYIDRLPVATNPVDYVMVATAALLICSVATIYPAGAASRLRPVEGLRYE